ncbi:hypothetical protein AWZ03_002106 [Drosophila navojoa]|uniref:HTH OST-type domain-containing protein n=1 Tax=Drosophila navojoa TaxID=7232 RepID=A0A484BS41_DRONA|nr:hypothetical protein AWZ03_002106 [Drosophila navojoa]
MVDQGFLSYVKKLIHSLVVSTPDRVTIERLERDYVNVEGCAVPFNKLGFKNIESLLRSIPDTVESTWTDQHIDYSSSDEGSESDAIPVFAVVASPHSFYFWLHDEEYEDYKGMSYNMQLPPQCWPGRLACITPRQGQYFSMEASNYFYDIVCYRRLFAKIEKINDADNTCTMILVDPNSSLHTKNINMALIESGWVRRCYKP